MNAKIQNVINTIRNQVQPILQQVQEYVSARQVMYAAGIASTLFWLGTNGVSNIFIIALHMCGLIGPILQTAHCVSSTIAPDEALTEFNSPQQLQSLLKFWLVYGLSLGLSRLITPIASIMFPASLIFNAFFLALFLKPGFVSNLVYDHVYQRLFASSRVQRLDSFVNKKLSKMMSSAGAQIQQAVRPAVDAFTHAIDSEALTPRSSNPIPPAPTPAHGDDLHTPASETSLFSKQQMNNFAKDINDKYEKKSHKQHKQPHLSLLHEDEKAPVE
jgi:hypothetical protein